MEEYKEKYIKDKNPNPTDYSYCIHITMNMLVNNLLFLCPFYPEIDNNDWCPLVHCCPQL